MSEQNWYHAAKDAQEGPFTLDQVRALYNSGTLTSDTLVWSKGMEQWEKLSSTPLAGILAANSDPASIGTVPAFPGTQLPPFVNMAVAPGFTDAVRICLRKFLDFSGRATRPEYWYFVLFGLLASIVASVLDAIIFGFGNNIAPINLLVSLALLIPSASVAVRRLHDTDRSAWWLLILLVPIIGLITIIVFMCFAGTPGRNRFDVPPATTDA